MAATAVSPDAQEGFAAFLAKRTPRFGEAAGAAAGAQPEPGDAPTQAATAS